MFGFVSKSANAVGWRLDQTSAWTSASDVFPGIGKEFMPSLDEGSYLLMPTSMPHTGIEQNVDYIKMLDKRLATIPEVDVAVGKWGRVNSALDPAPVQMFENTINYKSEYVLDEDGRRKRFKADNQGNFFLNIDSVKNEIIRNKIEINGNR